MMIFKRSLQRYGQTPEPETPYQRASQLWDERIGTARVQARNWRLMALGNLALAAGLAAALIWQSQQSRVVPYVVEVDRLGQALAAVPATQDYTPGDPQIAWHLARFIKNVRSVALDPVLMREAWLAAYDFADGRGARFLDEYARENDPFAEIGNRSISVQVTSALRASARSFQLQWTERHYQHGSLARTERWTAILTFDVRPPRSVDVLRKNPLGLYVTAIDWNRELEPESAGPPAQPVTAEMPAEAKGDFLMPTETRSEP